MIGKGTSRSFVSPWVSACRTLVEIGTSVHRRDLLFKWPHKSTKTPVHNAEISHEVLVGYLHSNSPCFTYSRNRKRGNGRRR